MDNDIPPKLCRSLKNLNIDIIHLQEEWPHRFNRRGVLDINWMPEVAKMDRIVISCDRRITRNPRESLEFRRCNLRCYFLYSGFSSQLIDDQYTAIHRLWPYIALHSETCEYGKAYEVKRDGNIVGMRLSKRNPI